MMDYESPRAAFSASERPLPPVVEVKQFVQAIIFGKMQEEGTLGGIGEEFGRVLTEMYETQDENKERETKEFRQLFAGITRQNLNDPEIVGRIAEIERRVRAKMTKPIESRRAA